MNSTLIFGRRHTLTTVRSGLVLEMNSNLFAGHFDDGMSLFVEKSLMFELEGRGVFEVRR